MAELKTKVNDGDVAAFLRSVPEQRRVDCEAVLGLMQDVTGEPPKMWGSSIVGFGSYHYRYASGREGDWFRAGFAPRKQSMTIYLTSDLERHADLLERLGPHTTGKACLYVKKLADVDVDVLRELVERSVQETAAPADPV